MDPAHGPSSVLSGKTKTDINGKVVRAIEEEKAAQSAVHEVRRRL